MKKTIALTLGILALLISSGRGFSADAQAELKALNTKIHSQIADGKHSEADFADVLKEFDALLQEHKGEKTDAVAQILYSKAMIYGQLFQNEAKADELVKQMKIEFKGTDFVAKIEKQEAAEEEAKKISKSLAVGTPFPDFDEKDVNGKPISVASHKGKIVMIDFWATWCGPCRGELPNVIATYGKHHDQGFDIIGISLDSEKDKLTEYTSSMKMTWPQYFDGQGWGNKLAGKYGIRSIPATYLIDGDGKIIGKDLRGEELEKAVELAMAKK